ncbi:hypothetical protein [Streptomyces afghaniensis]|uniref:hypothetical protein n=1 Tax=Streptomyces afghaniensis TaxID=66865 RepID=UPI00378E44BB
MSEPGLRGQVQRSSGDAAAAGIKAADEDSVAGRRLHEMQDFYTFMQREMADLIDKWREQYDAVER